jgi:ferritin-like metal-binding protein YciE
MADPTARELLLVQYLNEAYGKEKQLEVTLQAQIKLAEKTLKKRLQDHYKETKQQSRNLEKRIKQLGGKADAGPDLPGPDVVGGAVGGATNLANKALAAAKGPVQALRGTSPADNLLRNVRDAFWNEAEEIAHYNVIENFANELGDKETAKLAKEHRRQEERMQKFLEGQLKQLVKAVIKTEVPASERKPAGTSSSSSRSRSSSSSSRSGGTSRSASSSSSSRSSGSSRSGSSGTKKSSGSSSRSSGASASKRSTSRSSGSGSSGTKRSASSSSKSTGSTAKRSSRSSGSGGSSGSSGSGSSGGSSS